MKERGNMFKYIRAYPPASCWKLPCAFGFREDRRMYSEEINQFIAIY